MAQVLEFKYNGIWQKVTLPEQMTKKALLQSLGINLKYKMINAIYKAPILGHPMRVTFESRVYDGWKSYDFPGGTLESRHKFESKSFLEQWLIQFSIQQQQAAKTLVDIASGSTSRTASSRAFGSDAAINTTDPGIRWGTGSTAVSATQRALVTAIAHGSGSGQLSHQAMNYVDVSTSSPTVTYKAQRAAINNSGGTISPTEVGLSSRQDSATVYHQGLRDLDSQTVNNTKTITGTYTYTTTA